jgi:hypothetical protein
LALWSGAGRGAQRTVRKQRLVSDVIQQADNKRVVERIDDPSELAVTFGTIEPMDFETAAVQLGTAASEKYKRRCATGAVQDPHPPIQA